MSPKKVGRYEVIRELGRGGMATVYHARDPRFKREVALKVLPKELLHNRQLKKRFERESQTIASLEHYAIVPVYDGGIFERQPYLVMRYMDGGSLATRLENGALTLKESAEVLERIAAALDYAHSQGVIHRDLKPGNVLFDRFGEPFLSDFGIVRLEEATQTITKTGSILGTPAYMSPEQVQGEDKLTGCSDVYALGIILFEMLTGQQPFRADTPTRVMMKHVLDPVPRIRDYAPKLPEGTDQVLASALAKAPRERYASAGKLAEATQALLNEKEPKAAMLSETLVHEPAPVPSPRPLSQTIVPTSFDRPQPRPVYGLSLRERAMYGGLAIAGVIAALVLGAGALAGPPPGPTPIPTPDQTALAIQARLSATPTPTITLTASATPSPTPTVTASPTPIPPTPTPNFVMLSITTSAHCRVGPAKTYSLVDYLTVGETIRAYGQNPDGEWWWVELPDGSDFCWVSGNLVTLVMSPFATPGEEATIMPLQTPFRTTTPNATP